MQIRDIPRKILMMIVWAYLMVIPIYGQVLEPTVAARAGIIWIALALALMYEYRNTDPNELECWGNWCKWKFFQEKKEP